MVKFLVAEAVIPEYLPVNQAVERNEVIENYFTLGFSASEILSFLVDVHGIHLSLRQLRRILRSRGCRRRGQASDMNVIVQAVEEELNGSGSIIGYRSMHQRLTAEHRLIVTRNTVRQVLKILDPEGVQARSRHRLRRRNYSTKGPNYLWHMDGWDKLKPFGFAVHGSIDGYSRKILWLEVCNSNNDPRIITKYYLDYVRQVGGTSRIIRADRGTENGNVAAIQRFFRRFADDDFQGDKSFMYGRSTANQRIEVWWSTLRKQCSDWWIRHFKDLRDVGLFSDDIVHSECLKFCYMDLLQTELHKVAQLWNTHRIRPSANLESPAGRPDFLYFIPRSTNTRDYLTQVGVDELDIAEEHCAQVPSLRGCSSHFNELAEMIMEDEGLEMPNTAEEAHDLYITLLSLIDDL